MKPEWCPQDIWFAAYNAIGFDSGCDCDHCCQTQGLAEPIARAIMAAEKRGEEAAQAKMAALLKDPAAVRVNYLRGDIACHDLIREGEEREREAIINECEAQKLDFLTPGYSANQPLGSLCERFAIDECIRAIRNRGKP